MPAEAPTDIVHELRRLALWAIWIALICLFIWYASELFFLGFAGFLLAIVLRAFANWIEEHTRLGPALSYATTVCGLAFLAGLIAWLIVPRVISQGAQIAQVIPGSLMQAKTWLNRSQWGTYVVQFAQQSLTDMHPGIQLEMLGKTIVHAVAGAIVIAIVGFYAALHPREYTNGLLRLVPEAQRAKARKVGSEIVYTLRWWLLGQLVPMVVLGSVSMIGLWILGVPLAFTLGLLTGVMIFVPYLGAIFSEIPAVLVALKVSPKTMLYVIILYLVIHVVEGYILTPLVQKRAVRLLPIVTILAQFLMWILTGVLGVAIATPLAATGLVLVKMLYLREEIQH